MDITEDVVIIIQDVRIISDKDANREIRKYVESKDTWVSIAELAEELVLPFGQIERLIKLEAV